MREIFRVLGLSWFLFVKAALVIAATIFFWKLFC